MSGTRLKPARTVFGLLLAAISLCFFSSWGFFAHVEINRLAVYTLPSEMGSFLKRNQEYLSEHAVDPDKRRYADTAEAPRHYLDTELYETHIDSIPRKWEDALNRYGAQKLRQNGTLPWQIIKSYYRLVHAFQEKDSARILIYAAYLGHYVADAHVPLHTTQNHDGQLSNQKGIHAFWESRLPELFSKDYNYLTGRATYINNPLKTTWEIISHTHALVDSVLNCEASISAEFPGRQKYGFSKRNGQLLRQYSENYSRAYHQRLNGMVERQMRASIQQIGSFWYSAWIDAGQPDL